MQLFHEMKQRFPAIPDRVVSECIRQNFNDKQICEAVLTVKNRNYSRRLFPPPHMSKMLPASINEGVSAAGTTDISVTESETESSRCEDDDNSCSSSITSETEDSEANRTTQKSEDSERSDTQTSSIAAAIPNKTSKTSSTEKVDNRGDRIKCNSSEPFVEPPKLKKAEGVRVATQTSSESTRHRTDTSSTVEESDNQWGKIRCSSCEPFEVPPNFGSQLSQEGCGRGIGGGCCCRHAEDMDFLRQFDDGGGWANVGERVPIRYRSTGASVLPQTDNDLAGLGDSGLFRDNLGGVTKNSPVTNYPSRNGASSLMSVSIPGVRPPPTSHIPNLSDLSTQTSNLNISAPVFGSDFDCLKQHPEERTSRGMDDMDFEESRNQVPSVDPLSPTYQSPYTYDPNIAFGGPSFMDDPPVLPHDVEDFLRCDVKLRTSGGSSHFIDCEDDTGFHLCGKGETTTSSTVKVDTSPFTSQLNRKHTRSPGLQPAPVFAGQSRFQGKKGSPPPLGKPTTPTNYSNVSLSPTSPQSPLSYTRFNFTLRQPTLEPLPPIDIRSSVGDSRHTYNSASSYSPEPAFQSDIQIRIGGVAGISSTSGYGPTSPSLNPQSPQQSDKNLSPHKTPASQMRTSNPNSRLQVPNNRCGEKKYHSPQPTKRANPERPRSLCRPSSPGDIGNAAQASGSLPDVSKARSFAGEHDSVGVSSRQTGVHHQQDRRVRPNSSVPSSPASGFPPPRPSTTTHSPKDRSRVPGTAPSHSSVDHSRSTTCADVSRCKARLLHQIERKNLLEKELNRERKKLKTMHENVKMMEKDLQQRQMQQRTRATYPIIQRVHTLRHEIQVLQDECKKMTNEVDLNSDIQVPLGETDEEFYKNIYTGQQGWVLLPPINAQFHASRRPENLHRQAREFRERCRDNVVTAGMDVPGGREEGRMRGGAGEGIGASGEGPNWTCSMCTFRNHPALDKCEECEMPRINLEGSQTQDIHIHVTHHNFPMRRVLHSWVV